MGSLLRHFSREVVMIHVMKLTAVDIFAPLYLTFLFCGSAFAAEPATQPSDFRPLFNGKDLTGWTPVGRAVWRVEDGVIVGTQDGDASRSGVLDTKDQYQDFE